MKFFSENHSGDVDNHSGRLGFFIHFSPESLFTSRRNPYSHHSGTIIHMPRNPNGQCEFWYQPDGWGKAYRFLALRYEKTAKVDAADTVEQYQLFETAKYIYRVFVTSMAGPVHELVAFYNQRAAAENLIKEANNDAGLAAHPSGRWMMNCNWFQIAMLAYNLNCWIQLFNREEGAEVGSMRHTTLATARMRDRKSTRLNS